MAGIATTPVVIVGSRRVGMALQDVSNGHGILVGMVGTALRDMVIKATPHVDSWTLGNFCHS